MNKMRLLTLLLILLTAVLAACGGEEATEAPTPTVAPAAEDVGTTEEDADAADAEMAEEEMAPTIAEIAVADGNFTTLVTALEAAGLVETLQGEGPFTVFAPTDDAFAALPEGTVESLLADPDALREVLLYHVVEGEVMAADVVGLDTAPSVQGEAIDVTVDGETVMVNEATVVTTDIEASNGVIHVIDAVILPPSVSEAMEQASIVETAAEAGQFTTLLAAAEAAGLVETLQGEGPFTLFAPTDAAFAALPDGTLDSLLADPDALREVLLYHVVEGEVMAADVVGLDTAPSVQGEAIDITVDGETVMVNEATVVATDIETANGVIHVIDAVILPPSMAAADEAPDIVETAAEAGQFTTLLAAAEAAGLVETLQGEGPFTVFAPTDEAFAALGQETIDSLLADPDALQEILLYHVVPGQVMAADVVSLNGAVTAAGYPLAIRVDGETVMVNEATVVTTDIEASNGVIHVIDSVLLPPSGNLVDIAAADGRFGTLLAAAEAAGLAEALSADGPLTLFAPTDDAFAVLGEETINSLLADPEALSQILLYHVVDGALFAGDVVMMDSIETLQGESLTIMVDEEGNVFANDAQIVITDILATNGIVHVIDAVLLPPSQ